MYFSQTKDRIFIRTKAVFGLKVEECHPAKSIDKVMQVVEILKKKSLKVEKEIS